MTRSCLKMQIFVSLLIKQASICTNLAVWYWLMNPLGYRILIFGHFLTRNKIVNIHNLNSLFLRLLMFRFIRMFLCSFVMGLFGLRNLYPCHRLYAFFVWIIIFYLLLLIGESYLLRRIFFFFLWVWSFLYVFYLWMWLILI